jgi:hypothetical protein
MQKTATFKCFTLATLLLLTATFSYAQRLYGGNYTAERIANLRNNCDKYDWARQQRVRAVKVAADWVSKSDEELWAMVPGQDLPRCIDVTFDRLTTGPKFLGCLNCGKKILSYGTYPYNPDFVSKPWKLTCPSCHAVFPTNDFGKYYASAIDEHGLFNPAKGDKKLLFNTEHPDPKDPLHTYGVDDGFGYINKEGRSYKYIAYYVWKYWDNVCNGLNVLADAYLYTGDKRYAHKAAILLDRIADVYPDMDWKPYADRGWLHSDKGRNRGKIQGGIWECGTAVGFALAYDKIISGTPDDTELYRFLVSQSKKYQLPTQKGTRALFVKNVDDRILRTAFKAVESGQIYGNEGLHHLTAAECALALNTEPETSDMLDWLFKTKGGNIPGLMLGPFDHDGSTNEGAPNYTFMWGNFMYRMAGLLENYPAYTRHNLFKEFPQLNVIFTTAYRMAVLGIAVPNIGDSGATGLVDNKFIKPQFMAGGYKYTHDPKIAIAAYRANNNSANGLGRDIFAKEPDALSREIQTIAEKAGPRPVTSDLMSGFGLATLESGNGASAIALAANYGRTIKHAHPDMLNFDLLAFGHWLAPDMGYPEFATTWPGNDEWTGSTLSHNVVFVNKRPQTEIWSGHTRLFKQVKGLSAFELDGSGAYPEVKSYTRTMLLIGGDDNTNAYVVDIFRVTGGTDHVYSFHGPPGTVISKGLNLTAQKTGTYAGEDIPKGALAKNFPVGYSYLYNVQRDAHPAKQFMIDWKAQAGYRGLTDKDDLHLRMHALNQVQDVALADGDPPQNKDGNPKKLEFVLLHRQAGELNSTFVNVFEPYQKTPFIKSVKRLDYGQGVQVALAIEHTDGTIDHILYNPENNKLMTLPGGISMTGTIGYIKEKNKAAVKGVLVNGSLLKFGQKTLKSTEISGKVIKMNKELAGGAWVLVDAKLPTNGSLNGEQLMVDTKGERDATYTISSITREGDMSRIYCGPITFIKGLKKGSDANPAYLYDFEEGAGFSIANHAIWLKPTK